MGGVRAEVREKGYGRMGKTKGFIEPKGSRRRVEGKGGVKV